MSSEYFSHQYKMPTNGIFADAIEISSIPDAGEYLCYLTILSTMVSSLQCTVEGKV